MAAGAAERCAEHRGLLYAVAYRVLGSVAEADDVVQDAWLRWSRVDTDTVADTEGYLVRVATRLAIDRPRSASIGTTCVVRRTVAARADAHHPGCVGGRRTR